MCSAAVATSFSSWLMTSSSVDVALPSSSSNGRSTCPLGAESWLCSTVSHSASSFVEAAADSLVFFAAGAADESSVEGSFLGGEGKSDASLAGELEEAAGALPSVGGKYFLALREIPRVQK